MSDWPPARAAALERLDHFAARAGRHYAATRNADPGPGHRDNVSGLSPWIRYRILTEREVISTVLERHSPNAADKFIQEVFWRTYWKGWLQMRPSVWALFVSARDQLRATAVTSSSMAERLDQAEKGHTGIEGFDDWARELVETGYLHNHARMWFASIWIFTLKLPWELGADFFLRHLLDADPASNTLSWRWVAGLQTPGKTYLARADNIEKYTEGRFRPQGLADRADALEGPSPPPAIELPSARLEDAVDFSGQVLLVTPEDLHPESLIAGRGDPARVLVAGPEVFEPDWPWGDKARAFVSGAVDDTVRRISAMGLSAERVHVLDGPSLQAAAAEHGVDRILTSQAPVGPVADGLQRRRAELNELGLELATVRRAWDHEAWPHARRGFFPFRKKIPELLQQAGLVE